MGIFYEEEPQPISIPSQDKADENDSIPIPNRRNSQTVTKRKVARQEIS